MRLQVKIFTYNIHKGFTAGRLRFVLPAMREAMMTINPDIIFLQEVQGASDYKETHKKIGAPLSQFEFLADNAWPYQVYGKNAIYESGHHGNAILSKSPFSHYENINLTHVKRASRSLLHAVMPIVGHARPLHLVCVHFGLFKSERDKQFKRLVQCIQGDVHQDNPLIIAGDFNDWRNHAANYLEGELGVKEVFKEMKGQYEKTFPALRPTLSIDRIYFRGLTLQTGLCLKRKPWRLLSDHLPLYAIFSIP